MDKGTNQYITRFLEHLPLNSNDRVSVVLKGHLLIEELLGKLIEVHVVDSLPLRDARFTFKQKLCLAQAFCSNESNSKLWKSIELLNNLRNKLAHSLEPENIEMKLNKFIELISNFNFESEFVDNEKTFGTLTCCIFCIYMSLASQIQ